MLPSLLTGTVRLPASKSISARALVVSALAGSPLPHGLSDCDDTRVLRRALADRPAVIDILAAGTAMRFSTAFFAVQEGTHVITGTERMKQRPIGILVDALRRLGADIDYVENEGFPPLRVTGRHLRGGDISISASVSSQYISALLMIAPMMTDGLTLHLEGEIVSTPYIDMTLSILKTYGATARWVDERTLRVEHGGLESGVTFSVEPDWSAASYWYELLALCPNASSRITLPRLHRTSVQGDSVVWQRFEALGVHTEFTDEGAVLTKCAPHLPSNFTTSQLHNFRANESQGEAELSLGREQPKMREANFTTRLDFTRCPDLAQTFVVTCAILGRPFVFTGLQSLRIKETDRIAALTAELRKLGCIVEGDDRSMTYRGETCPPEPEPVIATYADHRMAMAFAPCAYRFPTLRIANPEVVSKSYPTFWEDLNSLSCEVVKM